MIAARLHRAARSHRPARLDRSARLRRARRLAVGVVATAVPVLALALVAGCASVPSGGQVASGRTAEPAEPFDDPYVRIVPVRPRQDWLPEDILSGFLTASASFDDRHRTAAEYLAPGVTWRPGPAPSVIIYDDSTLRFVPAKAAENRSESRVVIEVRGTRLGSIRADGQYEAADSKTLQERFELAKNAAGQWRISKLPEVLATGLLLSRRDVERAFRTRNLYFFAPDNKVLVPNTIFLPLVDRSNLPSQLVRALLNGPTSWLKPAVRSAFPPGTRLLGQGVMISDGIATVDLGKEARRGDRAAMSAQLMWTLGQLPEVGRMKLKIGGEDVAPSDVEEIQSPRDWAGNDPDAIMGRLPRPAYLRGAGGHLNLLADDRAVRPGTLADNKLDRPAISLDGRTVAGLNESRDTVLIGPLDGSDGLRPALEAAHPRARFTTPSWDRHGNLWVVESAGGRSWLWVSQPGRPAVRIDRWGLAARQVNTLRVATDGVRVAAIVQNGDHGRIEIGRIAVDAAGNISVEEFLPISADITDAIDLAWQDAGELAVLGRAKSSSAQELPYTVPISGGTIRAIGNATPAEAHSITAAPNSPVLIEASVPADGRPGDTEQRVCRLQDPHDTFSEWQCHVPGTAPAYPG